MEGLGIPAPEERRPQASPPPHASGPSPPPCAALASQPPWHMAVDPAQARQLRAGDRGVSKDASAPVTSLATQPPSQTADDIITTATAGSPVTPQAPNSSHM